MNLVVVGIFVSTILLLGATTNGYAQETIPTVEEKIVQLKSHKIKSEKFSDRLIGQVQNNAGENVEFVKIIATFYDDAGDILGTDFSYTDPSDLITNMKAPFEMYLDEDVADDYGSYDLMLTWNYADRSGEDSKVYEFPGEVKATEKEGDEDEEED